MIKRVELLEELTSFLDKSVIKVIVGIRRSGKSVLLEQFKELLLDRGIRPTQIIHMNFESMVFDEIRDYKALYDVVRKQVVSGDKMYLLFDEIQQVEHWEKAVSSFQVDFNCDLYLTGSNAYLLSSELATLISGRYVTIHVLPLSLKELSKASPDVTQRELMDRYVHFGGFPGLLEFESIDQTYLQYLEGIYSTVVIKDILTRTKITDVDLLNRILAYVLDNVGNLISANKVANHLTSKGRKTAVTTVIDYLQALENAFVLYRVKRYRIKGKSLLSAPDKYYVVDVALRRTVHAHEQMDIGRVLENIVFLELIRRGYKVYVGADQHFEVDFIASRGDRIVYYQVSLSIADPKVKEREIRGLLSIQDNYEKVLLTMDYAGGETISGVIHRNMIDFLLE